MKLIVKHVDGITDVLAIGNVKNSFFIGEYELDGMTYGINIPFKQRYVCGYCGNEVDENGKPIMSDNYPTNPQKIEGSCCIMRERLGSF